MTKTFASLFLSTLCVALSFVHCGQSKGDNPADSRLRISAGGTEVDERLKGKSAFLVDIMKFRTPEGQVLFHHDTCTGTLISKKLILTAAHCVEDTSFGPSYPVDWRISIAADSWFELDRLMDNMFSLGEKLEPITGPEFLDLYEGPGEFVKVTSTFVPSAYEKRESPQQGADNDIAIVRVKKKLQALEVVPLGDFSAHLGEEEAIPLTMVGYGVTDCKVSRDVLEPDDETPLVQVGSSLGFRQGKFLFDLLADTKYRRASGVKNLRLIQLDATGCDGDSGSGLLSGAAPEEMEVLFVYGGTTSTESQEGQRWVVGAQSVPVASAPFCEVAKAAGFQWEWCQQSLEE